jgi:hypothetical protein
MAPALFCGLNLDLRQMLDIEKTSALAPALEMGKTLRRCARTVAAKPPVLAAGKPGSSRLWL